MDDFETDSDKSPNRRKLNESKYTVIDEVNAQFNNIIEDFDNNLQKKLKSMELDYLKGYSMYVKEKETELKHLVNKLNERS